MVDFACAAPAPQTRRTKEKKVASSHNQCALPCAVEDRHSGPRAPNLAAGFESGWKRADRALDTFRDLAGAVGIGIGHFLHIGWVHPPPVDLGRRGSCSTYCRVEGLLGGGDTNTKPIIGIGVVLIVYQARHG